MLTDTHTHLYLSDFSEENSSGCIDAVKRAIDAGVVRMIFPNVDLTTIEPMNKLHSLFPKNTSMAMGLHPTEVKENFTEVLPQIWEEINSGKYCAVGEVGIDLYWDTTFTQEQMEVFDLQASWASKLKLPMIIHCRNGLDQLLEVLQGHRTLTGVMHSFGGSPKDVNRVRNVVDFYFGINGVVTFKNSSVKDSLQEISVERLLLETDAPYLAPVPKRGQRNESSYLNYTADFIANHMGLNRNELETHTNNNALKLFGDKSPIAIE